MNSKKWIALFGVFFLFSQFTYAQSHPIKGKVKDEKGAPVPFASISIKGGKTFVTADSLGLFSVNAGVNSLLVISSVGFEEKTILINKGTKDTLTIFLKQISNALHDVVVEGNSRNMVKEKEVTADRSMSTANQQIIASTLQDYAKTLSSGPTVFEGVNASGAGRPTSYHIFSSDAASRIYTGSLMPVFSQKENTKGSRYFSDKWMDGSVTSTNNSVVEGGYLLNYDKTGGNLLMTLDKQVVIEATKEEVRSFVLKKDNGEIRFERIEAISNKNFLQVLSAPGGAKYKLLKLINTKFEKANYVSDGLTERGHNYDEFMDEFIYFILFPGGKEFRTVELKRKSIKEVLESEQAKVTAYFSQHRDSFADEEFLIGLVNSLN